MNDSEKSTDIVETTDYLEAVSACKMALEEDKP